jgi:hypothetical protein
MIEEAVSVGIILQEDEVDSLLYFISGVAYFVGLRE